MIDYHSHLAILAAVKEALKTAFPNDPARAAQAKALTAAVEIDPDAANLGGCLDAVLEHASEDGSELDLLERAAALWRHGRAVYDELTLARQEFELAAADPSAPGAVQTMQSSLNRLDALRSTIRQLGAQSATLRSEVAPMPHLAAHPRQRDRPSAEWTWRDLFAGRRTEAFVASLFGDLSDVRSRAFAAGVLAGYAGNVSGSSFLGAVVGGPRRLHRYRDRLARNSVGAWMHSRGLTPRCDEIGRGFEYRGTTDALMFPGALKGRLIAALNKAYPNRATPDLDLGIGRMVRHLHLLDSFERPPAPEPPMTFFSGFDHDNPGGSVFDDGAEGPPEVAEPPGLGGNAPDPFMSTHPPSSAHSKSSSGDGCIAVLLAVAGVVGITLLLVCIGQLTTGEKCNPWTAIDGLQGSEEPDPRAPTSINQQQLEALSQPDALGHVLKHFFGLQLSCWQAFDLARSYLAVTGLIYPDALQITSPLYQQFLKTPERPSWPHREEAAPLETYHRDPSSPIEQPATASPFPSGRTPAVLLAPWPSDYQHSATAIAMPLVERLLTGDAGENLDLDADRGFRHACWAVAPGTSIGAASLSVDILDYGEV